MNRDTWNTSVTVPRVAAISKRRGVLSKRRQFFRLPSYCMAQAELKTLPSGWLFGYCALYFFGYCASYFDGDRYWEEFVLRFNPCLTNSVYQTYRRLSINGPPSSEIVSDLFQ
jgi:hypothetical protein